MKIAIIIVAFLITPGITGDGYLYKPMKCQYAIQPKFYYPSKMLDECGQLLDPHMEKR